MEHLLTEGPLSASEQITEESPRPRFKYDNIRKRSILHVGNFLSAKGTSRQFVEELADCMQQIGWVVFRTSHILNKPGRLIDMAYTIVSRRKRYEVAHLTLFSGRAFLWGLVAVSLLRTMHKPIILSMHGGNLPNFAKRWGFLVRWVLNSATTVVCPSNYLFEAMRPYRADIHIIPNPIDVDRYAFTLRSQPRPHLIWLRGFHRIYNPELAPQVIKLLAADYPDALLEMIGPAGWDGSFQSTAHLASRLGVTDRVKIRGPVPKHEVPAALNTGDIFINTTNIDNTPTSVIEAMACGLCVVSTNVGGIPFLLSHEEDALLVPPNDPEAMAGAVKRLLTEPGLAERLSRNARKKIEQFDWSKILLQWVSLFQ